MNTNIIQFDPTAQQDTRPAEVQSTSQPEEDKEPRFWDYDEIQAVIREAFRRGIDPAVLFAQMGFDPAA